ncbi:piggyBac transposable element-derived protein 3-like [Bactrocera neohumeralis]|uniref:piggyBac transposable element-derived protein 3-like n=1 Tax=Bactrocera neohumeralis TaxID=98809 RepID=UPI002165415B|nr:piggyBac transposable element-derived protein 3-like [Bactrocera neohumeralis]
MDIAYEEVVETQREALPSTSKSDAESTGPPQKKPRVSYKPVSSFGTPKWSRNKGKEEFHYDISPQEAPLTDMQKDVCELLKDLSPIQLFSKFYDGEVLDYIITETNRFAAQNNAGFHLDVVILKRFLGILLISGYHTLPSIEDYWSSQLSLGIAIVQQARATFMHVKRYIHFANNDELDVNDKMAKLSRFFDIINRKFKQFGIWSEFLSIDEQMVPYFGRHSCKMFILGKPIRFGYKLWCLCSSTDYLFSFIPYCGQSDEYNRELGLGADVVLRLLSNVEAPMRHVVFFDNFFTSYHLLCLLSAKGFCATGTVRCNRVAGEAINMKTGKDLPRGARDYMYDSKKQITLCRWQDNKEVTIATNHDQILPLYPVRHWQKATKASKKSLGENGKFVNVDQTAVLHNYNKGMGGVDLHDNAIQNYRVNIRGKRWYWPLWINTVNSSTVNARKLHCLVAKYKNEKPMSQKQFKSSVTESLLLTDEKEALEVDEDLEFQRPRNLPNLKTTVTAANCCYVSPEMCLCNIM